jgi:aminopeptidase N
MLKRFMALALLCGPVGLSAQTVAGTPRAFSHADTLRGSNGPGRNWWDVEFYDLHVTVNPTDSSIVGYNGITYRVTRAPNPSSSSRTLHPGALQIDLQVPLTIDSIIQDKKRLEFRRDSNAFFVTPGTPQAVGSHQTLTVFYHGKPVVAARPPWDGGFIWQHDSAGNRFVATANEGLGASVWWPNKDFGGDEPDSQRVAITVPDSMVDVSNGRLRSVTHGPNGTTWEWFVSSPINNYSISVNAARYAHFTRYFAGEKGTLTMDFYPLAIHEDTARVQFKQAASMMACFEHWFGPYPWYEDGYKLVEAPHLGMEHQSAVAYGNKYKNGYLGRDLSRTGHGLKWDFIIVHESAHEWWGNNVSMNDAADMWIHESFANYSESLYTECMEGKQAGAEYVIGSRVGVRHDRPVVGVRGVNNEGSGDMYPKGGNMLHTIRQLVGDDEKWRAILRGAQATFARKTIAGAELQAYISAQAGMDLSKVFEQYLTTTMIPRLEYKVDAGSLQYRWANAVPGFDMPVDVVMSDAPSVWRRIRPTTQWSALALAMKPGDSLGVRPDFYVETMLVQP